MAIGLALAAAGTIAGIVQKGIAARRQRKAANKINPVNPVYEATKESAQELAMARQANNADVAGGAAMERSAYTQGANTVAAVMKAGGSPAQVAATIARSNMATNKAMADLTIRRTQQKLATMGLVQGALRARSQQRMMEHQDKIRRYEGDQAAKDALYQSADQNVAGMFNDAAGFGLTAAMGGLDKGVGKKLGGIFGKSMKASKFQKSLKAAQTAGKIVGSTDFLPG
jgi:hypothetical protein